jgi:hypothetical protein
MFVAPLGPDDPGVCSRLQGDAVEPHSKSQARQPPQAGTPFVHAQTCVEVLHVMPLEQSLVVQHPLLATQELPQSFGVADGQVHWCVVVLQVLVPVQVAMQVPPQSSGVGAEHSHWPLVLHCLLDEQAPARVPHTTVPPHPSGIVPQTRLPHTSAAVFGTHTHWPLPLHWVPA